MMRLINLNIVALLMVGKVCLANEPVYVDEGYLQEDLTWLALNIYFEARNDPTIHGRLGVAHAVLNRVYSSKYPNTIKGVVTQPGQFSWYWDGKSDEPTDKKSWMTSWELAELALSTYNPNKSLGGALYYHAWYVDPYWTSDKVLVGNYGEHYFYR